MKVIDSWICLRGTDVIVTTKDKGRRICEVNHHDGREFKSRKERCLIGDVLAAAPDMLKALSDLEWIWMREPNDAHDEDEFCKYNCGNRKSEGHDKTCPYHKDNWLGKLLSRIEAMHSSSEPQTEELPSHDIDRARSALKRL